MQTYYSRCEKHTDNVCPKKLIMMTNVKVKGISRCVNCLTSKTFVPKIKHNDESRVIETQFLIG